MILSISEKLCKVAIWFLFALYITQQALYIYHLINTGWYIEPAENENMALISFIRGSWLFRSDDLAKNSIIQIYPDFFHRISSLVPLDPLISGRIVSIFTIVIAQTLFGAVIFKWCNSVYLSMLGVMSLYGVSSHEIYFLMCRVDGLYTSFGFVSLFLLISSRGPDKKRIKFPSTEKFILSAVASGIAVLGKQTGMVFILYSVIVIIYIWAENPRIALYKAMQYVWIVLVVVISYYIVFENNYLASRLGLELFSKDSFTLQNAFRLPVIITIVESGYFIIAGLAVFLLYFSWHNEIKIEFYTKVAIFLTTLLVSAKMWINTAAFYNSFIMIVFGTMLIALLSMSARQNIVACMFSLGIFSFGSVFGLKMVDYYSHKIFESEYQTLNFPFFSNIKGMLVENIKDAVWPDGIYNYLKNNRGRYITTRLDYYLTNTGNLMSYESSVHGMFSYGGLDVNKIADSDIRNVVVANNYKLRNNISNSEYEGVVLGLGSDQFISAYPEFINKYKPIVSEHVKNGLFGFLATLYVRR